MIYNIHNYTNLYIYILTLGVQASGPEPESKRSKQLGILGFLGWDCDSGFRVEGEEEARGCCARTLWSLQLYLILLDSSYLACWNPKPSALNRLFMPLPVGHKCFLCGEEERPRGNAKCEDP